MAEADKCGRYGGPIPAGAADGGCPRCMLEGGLASPSGPAAGVPSVADVERLIPGFEILSVVGHGGMGVVYKARQKALDRVVALKVLPPASAASPGFTERFAREAKALARLTHPHIVAVHDFGQSGDAAGGALCWLVMEYVDGMNVREAMRAGRITSKEALAIVPQICDALQYAHDRGVVHRDIKPENVLIDRDGRVKVADFGLAKLATRDAGDASLTGAQQVMGTVHYMAPEQWQHPKDVDHRADIYSLGVVFYEMLTGELPLGRFDPPSKRAVIDVRVDEVVMRSLERERERRWQHASEMRTHVEQIASAPAAPPPVPAVVAPAVASEPEDEGMKEAARAWPDTFPNAAITFSVAVAFGFAAYFAEPALWWAAGTVGLGAVWQANAAAENRAKEQRSASPAAPRVVTVPLFAPWVVALVGAAGVAIAYTVSWSAGSPPSGRSHTVATLGLLLAFAMAGLLIGRWLIARKLDDDGRRALGTPVLLVVFSTAALAIAASCLIPAKADLPRVDDVRVPPPARAPWEFELELPDGGATKHADELRDQLWKRFSALQAIHGSVDFTKLMDMYGRADWNHVAYMEGSERTAASAKGLLGLPLADAAKLGGPLSGFRIQKVVLGGLREKTSDTYTSAILVASDGRYTLRAPMVFGMNLVSGREDWNFAAAPVEVE